MASAFLLMTLTLRIETRGWFFFFFFARRQSRLAAGRKEPPRAVARVEREFVDRRTRRGMNNTLSLSDAVETLVGFGGTFLLIPKY